MTSNHEQREVQDTHIHWHLLAFTYQECEECRCREEYLTSQGEYISKLEAVFTVILDKDYREDDARMIMSFLENIRGVAKVLPHVVSASDLIDREKIKRDLLTKIYEVLE